MDKFDVVAAIIVKGDKYFIAQRNRFFSFIGTSILWITGWKVKGTIPDMKKLLVIIAPVGKYSRVSLLIILTVSLVAGQLIARISETENKLLIFS